MRSLLIVASVTALAAGLGVRAFDTAPFDYAQGGPVSERLNPVIELIEQQKPVFGEHR